MRSVSRPSLEGLRVSDLEADLCRRKLSFGCETRWQTGLTASPGVIIARTPGASVNMRILSRIPPSNGMFSISIVPLSSNEVVSPGMIVPQFRRDTIRCLIVVNIGLQGSPLEYSLRKMRLLETRDILGCRRECNVVIAGIYSSCQLANAVKCIAIIILSC